MIRVPEPVMGTVVSLSLDAPDVPTEKLWLAVAEARAVLHQADAVFSTWKANSPLNQLRRGELRLDQGPKEMAEVLLLCARAREISGGWFDPWASPGGVDPTGLVKGWAAARALDVFRRAGVSSAMVSAGGDVATLGHPGVEPRPAVADRDLRSLGPAGPGGGGRGARQRGRVHVWDLRTRAPTSLTPGPLSRRSGRCRPPLPARTWPSPMPSPPPWPSGATRPSTPSRRWRAIRAA